MGMSNLMATAIPLLAGLLIGTFFFAGLWWTVHRAVAARRPACWLIGSLLVRFSVVLSVFCLIGASHWRSWALCLVGFVLARALLQWWAGRAAREPRPASPESIHAP
jgi:F1F0 ATPase subunit 2